MKTRSRQNRKPAKVNILPRRKPADYWGRDRTIVRLHRRRFNKFSDRFGEINVELLFANRHWPVE